MTEPDTCPICGEDYEERHEVTDYEKLTGLKEAAEVMEKITDSIHVFEVENRMLVFYVHDGTIYIPDEESGDS